MIRMLSTVRGMLGMPRSINKGITPMYSSSPSILGAPPSRPPPPEAHLHTYPTQQLTHAFNTISLQDLSDSMWYMDTGATNHITNQPGMLRSLFNKSIISLPSVAVGNGSFARTTNIGHGVLPSHLFPRPLHLRHVLLCPSMIKNLISVLRFVTDNWRSVEFDPFGFSVKDFQTQAKLLRCDST